MNNDEQFRWLMMEAEHTKNTFSAQLLNDMDKEEAEVTSLSQYWPDIVSFHSHAKKKF